MTNIKHNYFNASMSDILSHHDVVFKAPTHDAAAGLPIGNGDSGCLMWTEADRIHIALNKTDLWDDVGSPDGIICRTDDENTMSCRHGAHLTIDLGCPALEMIYQKSYENRISLYNATAKISANTPFCKTSVSAFTSKDYDVSVVKLNISHSEQIPLSFSLSRYGSRNLRMWYWHYEPGTSVGLDGTLAEKNNGIMTIKQELKGTNFCVALLPVCQSELDFCNFGLHSIKATSPSLNDHDVILYIAIATGETIKVAEKNACSLVEKAALAGYDQIYEKHSKAWSDFWSKSFVSLPEKNDYQENLWYLNLYYANSSMGGNFPAHFCNGLWGFYHDFVPWGFYFHYNMLHAASPLEAANHPELLDTYYNFRFSQLTTAKAFAKKYKKTDGAFFSDICDGMGRHDPECINNCTCGAQLALMLYNHYLFSRDTNYLEKKAIPFMREIADFYLCMFKKGEDDKYHIYKTQGYEGSPLFDDSITDHSAIRALLAALSSVLTKEDFAKYEDLYINLAPYYTTELYDDEFRDGVFTRGIGKGKAIKGNKVFSVGKNSDTGELCRRTFGNPDNDYYGFPDTEMSTIFPSGLIGIKDKGSEYYNYAYNSVCLHHPTSEDGVDGECMGWCMEPIYLARMGLSDLLDTYMKNTINRWMYPFQQGFGCYTPTDAERFINHTLKFNVQNNKTNEFVHVPTWNFRHFDYETLPIISTATNEMLMQSYDGTIRLFCAIMPDEKYAFKLKAQGGFLVSAIYDCGNFDAYILSEFGGMLNLGFENISETPIFDVNMDIKESNGTYAIPTSKGEVVHIHSKCIPTFSRKYQKNTDAKTLGRAKLGEFGAYN